MAGRWSAFFDAAWPQPTDNSQRVWGVEPPTIKRSLIQLDRPAVGGYLLNGTSVITFPKTQSKERICEVFEQLRSKNSGKRIILVLDNFSAHTCEYTRKRATQLGIDLVFLPIASPDLNPIEQVWKHLKWIISPISVESKEEFRTLVASTFHQLTGRIGYASDWISRFLNIQKLS